MYKFDFNGMHFECDLDDENVVSGLIVEIGEEIRVVIDNKEQYRVITDAERIKQLEETVNFLLLGGL